MFFLCWDMASCVELSIWSFQCGAPWVLQNFVSTGLISRERNAFVLVRSAWPKYTGMEEHSPSFLLLVMYFSIFSIFLPFAQHLPSHHQRDENNDLE